MQDCSKSSDHRYAVDNTGNEITWKNYIEQAMNVFKYS